jgi:hypothetical protein
MEFAVEAPAKEGALAATASIMKSPMAAIPAADAAIPSGRKFEGAGGSYCRSSRTKRRHRSGGRDFRLANSHPSADAVTFEIHGINGVPRPLESGPGITRW